MRTWILTGSPENHAATRERDYRVIGLKERNRARAEQIEPGDRIVLYATKVMAFAGAITVEGGMFEDREKIWPGKPGKVDPYPWRFETRPEVVVDDPEGWVPRTRGGRSPARGWSSTIRRDGPPPRSSWTSSSTSPDGRASTGSSPS